MLDPNPQGDGVGRWDIWEVISHAGGALVSGISALFIRRDPREVPHTFFHVETQREDSRL